MQTKLTVVMSGMAFLSGLLQAEQKPSTPDHPIVVSQTLEAQFAWRKAQIGRAHV